jgi:Tfp pilus tip-associated adhesin PilY1/Tfp pilus assembly protein PilV
VLITLLVFSVGLLGYASLQNRAQKAQLEVYQRVYALNLVDYMVDQIRSNPLAQGCYGLAATEVGTGFSGSYSCSSYGTAETQAQVVDAVNEWSDLLKGTGEVVDGTSVVGLLNARGCIVYDSNSEVSSATIYLTVRRGGELLYALDVTDPESPVMKWRKSSADNGYSELGQTWSKPVVTKLKLGNQDKIVLMMGLGYDPDIDDGGSGTRTQGRGVIVIDALTGEDIWQVTSGSVSSPSGHVLSESKMVSSVPSDLAVVDRDGNGYSDRVYFGDTGGQLWRLDIGSTSVGDWKATRLFKFSTSSQRFLNAPDVIESPDGNYDMIIIGSGNREKPVDTSVQNYMVFYRDYDQTNSSTSTASLTENDLAAATTAVSGNTEVFDPDTDITSNSKFLKGWYLALEAGEKVVTSALTTNQVATFATNLPGQNDACTDLGEARIYKINPFSVLGKAPGEKNYVTVEGGGFLPPPVGFTVIVEEPTCDGNGNCTMEEKAVSGVMFGFHAEDTEGDPLGVRRRVWWYSKQDK